MKFTLILIVCATYIFGVTSNCLVISPCVFLSFHLVCSPILSKQAFTGNLVRWIRLKHECFYSFGHALGRGYPPVQEASCSTEWTIFFIQNTCQWNSTNKSQIYNNSISAKISHIQINSFWNNKSFIIIINVLSRLIFITWKTLASLSLQIITIFG